MTGGHAIDAHPVGRLEDAGGRPTGRPAVRQRRHASVFHVLGDEPEVASFHETNRRLTRDGYRRVIDSLARKRPLRASLSPDDATTILLVLLGTDVYRSMLEEHGWAEQKWRSWVIDTISEALTGRSAAG